MYTPTKLTEYLENFDVSWAKSLPENTPPDNVVVAYHKDILWHNESNRIKSYGK